MWGRDAGAALDRSSTVNPAFGKVVTDAERDVENTSFLTSSAVVFKASCTSRPPSPPQSMLGSVLVSVLVSAGALVPISIRIVPPPSPAPRSSLSASACVINPSSDRDLFSKLSWVFLKSARWAIAARLGRGGTGIAGVHQLDLLPEMFSLSRLYVNDPI